MGVTRGSKTGEPRASNSEPKSQFWHRCYLYPSPRMTWIYTHPSSGCRLGNQLQRPGLPGRALYYRAAACSTSLGSQLFSEEAEAFLVVDRQLISYSWSMYFWLGVQRTKSSLHLRLLSPRIDRSQNRSPDWLWVGNNSALVLELWQSNSLFCRHQSTFLTQSLAEQPFGRQFSRFGKQSFCLLHKYEKRTWCGLWLRIRSLRDFEGPLYFWIPRFRILLPGWLQTPSSHRWIHFVALGEK